VAVEELVRIKLKVIPDYAPVDKLDNRIERLEQPRTVRVSAKTEDAEKKVKRLQQVLKQTPIVPKFDHKPLTEFNKHLDLKELHWKRLAKILAEPLIPATNISQAEALLNKNIRANIDASLNVNFDYRRLQRAVERGTRDASKKGVVSTVVGGAANLVGSAVTAPFKLAAFTFANASAGIFRGFFEKIGQDISGKRLSGGIATGIDQGVDNFSKYTVRVVKSLGDAEKGIYKFIQTLLRTGDLTKAFEGYVEYGAKDFTQAFDKLQNLGTLMEIPAKQQKRKGKFVLDNFVEELDAYISQFKNIPLEDITKKDRTRTMLTDSAGFNDYLVNNVTKQIQPFVDTALDPLRNMVKPYLTAVSKIQAFNNLESAEKFRDAAVGGLPGTQLEKRLQLIIGGAQGVHGAGGHHVAEQLRELFINHNVIGIENPDTDPKGQEPGWLQKLVAAVAPDIGNNGAFLDTITNLQTQMTYAINPIAQSRAAAEALGTILAAQDLGYSDDDIAVGSYSLGGAELIRVAVALELLNKNIDLLAMAYPAANLIDIPKNFQSAVLDKDPLSSPIITGLFKQTENNRLLGDANLKVAGSDVHGIHHLFKSPAFRQMFEQAFKTTLPDNPSEAVKAGGEAYQILGALDQVKSFFSTGEFDMESPYKSFPTFDDTNATLLSMMSQIFSSARPSGALGSAVDIEREEMRGLVTAFLSELGVQIKPDASNTEIASQTKFLAEIGQYREIRDFLQGDETDARPGLQVQTKDPKRIQGSINQVQSYLDWISKTFTEDGEIAAGMKTMYDNFKLIRDGLKAIVEGNVASSQAIFSTLPDVAVQDTPELQKVLGMNLDTTQLASPSTNRTLGTDAAWAKKVPQAIVAYNKMVQVLKTQMPDPDEILAAAYGMSGGTAFVAEDFVYKTDTRDGRKIASEGEVNALNRLGGRYSSALVKAIPGEAIITDRAPGQSIKDHLLEALEPLKMAKKAYEDFAAEMEGQGQISPEYQKARAAYDEFKRNGQAALADFSEAFLQGQTQFSENEFKDEFAKREAEYESQVKAKREALKKVPQTSAAQQEDMAKLDQLSKAYEAAQQEFNKATELFYGKIGRLEATLQREGVAHNDLAAANVFYDPSTDALNAIDFGNANVDPTKMEKFKDSLTTNLRVLADNDFWGFINYISAFRGLQSGRAKPLATQERRVIGEDALPSGSGKAIELGTGTGEEFLKSLSDESREVYLKQKKANEELIRNSRSVVSAVDEVAESMADVAQPATEAATKMEEVTGTLGAVEQGMSQVSDKFGQLVAIVDKFLGGQASKILQASPLTESTGEGIENLSDINLGEGIILAKEGLADFIYELASIKDTYDKQMEYARPFFRFTTRGWAALLGFAKELEDVVLPSLPYAQTAKEVGQKAIVPAAIATGLSLLSPEAYAALHGAATMLTETGLASAQHLLQFQTAVGEAIPALHPLTQLGEGALKLANFLSKLPFAGEIGEGLLGTASLIGTGKLAQKGLKDTVGAITPKALQEEMALSFLPAETRKLLTGSGTSRANKQNRLSAIQGVKESLPTSENITDLLGLDLKSGGLLSSKELQQLVTYVTGTSARKLQQRVGRSRKALVEYLKNEKTYADELLFAAKLVVQGNADSTGEAEQQELSRHLNKAKLLMDTLKVAKERIAKQGAELADDPHVNAILADLVETRGKLQILQRSPRLSGQDKRTVGSRLGGISTSIRSVDDGENIGKTNLDARRAEEQAKFITRGYKQGIKQSLPELKAAGGEMSHMIFDGFDEDAEIQSPSKKAIRKANFIAAGLINGAYQSEQGIADAYRQISKAIFTALESLQDESIQTPEVLYDTLEQIEFLERRLQQLGSYDSGAASGAIAEAKQAIPRFASQSGIPVDQTVTEASTSREAQEVIKAVGNLTTGIVRTLSNLGVGRRDPNASFYEGLDTELPVSEAMKRAGQSTHQFADEVVNHSAMVARTADELGVSRKQSPEEQSRAEILDYLENRPPSFYDEIDPNLSVKEATERIGKSFNDVAEDVGYAGDQLANSLSELGVQVKATRQDENVAQLKRLRDLKARDDVFNAPPISQDELDALHYATPYGNENYTPNPDPWGESSSTKLEESAKAHQRSLQVQRRLTQEAEKQNMLHEERVQLAQEEDKQRLQSHFKQEQRRIKEAAHLKKQQDNAKRLREYAAKRAADDVWSQPILERSTPDTFIHPSVTGGRRTSPAEADPWASSDEYKQTALAVARIKATYEETLPLLKDMSRSDEEREEIAVLNTIAINRERDAILKLIQSLEQAGDAEELDEIARKLKDIQDLGEEFGNETADFFGRDNRQNAAFDLRFQTKRAKNRVNQGRQQTNVDRVNQAANLGADVSDFISARGNDLADLVADMGGLGNATQEVLDVMGAFGSPIFSTIIGQGKQLAATLGLVAKSSVLAQGVLAGGFFLLSANAVGTARQLKELRIQFQAVGEDGERALKKVFAQSQANGQAFQQTAELALGVTGALRFTRFEDETDNIVNNFQRVATAMQLTEDQAGRFQLGLVQGFGKGSASLEEIRQQIGEVIPQFIPTLARTQNLSIGQTIRAVSAGEVSSFAYAETLEQLAKDTQPAFQEGLESLTASTNRWNNSVTQINGSLGAMPLEIFEFLAAGATKLLSAAVPLAPAIAPVASIMSVVSLISFTKTILGLEAVQGALKGVGSVLGGTMKTMGLWLNSWTAIGVAAAAGIGIAIYSLYKFNKITDDTRRNLEKSFNTSTGFTSEDPAEDFFSIPKPKAKTPIGQFSDAVFDGSQVVTDTFNKLFGETEEQRKARKARYELEFVTSGEAEAAKELEGISEFLDGERLTNFRNKIRELARNPELFGSYRSQLDAIEQRESVLQARLTKISAGAVPGGKNEVDNINRELKELANQETEINLKFTGTDGGLGGIESGIRNLREEAKRLREEDNIQGALAIENEVRNLVQYQQIIERFAAFNPLRIDLELADSRYQDQMFELENAHNDMLSNLIDQRAAYTITAERLAQQEANAELSKIRQEEEALDKLIEARFKAFEESNKSGGLRELLGTEDLRSASFEQITSAISTIEGGDNSELEPFLNSLRETRELLREKGQKHLESARAAQREAEANVAYENSLRKIVNALAKVRAIKEGLDFSINIEAGQAQNALNRQFLAGNLSSLELDRELSIATRDVNDRQIAANEQIIAQSRAAIDKLDADQRAAAQRLLGGIDITQATMTQLNTVLAEYENVAATTGNNVVRGETVDGDIRGALEAAQFIWQQQAEIVSLEGQKLDSLRANAVTVTRGELRSLNQRIREHREGIQDYIRGINDRIEDLNVELFQITSQNRGLELRNKLRRNLIGLTESLQGDVGEAVIDSVIQITEILSNSRVTQVGRQIRDNALDLQRQLRNIRQGALDIESERRQIIEGGSNDILLGVRGVDSAASIEQRLNEQLAVPEVSVDPITEPLVKVGNSLTSFADSIEQSSVQSSTKVDSALQQFINDNFKQGPSEEFLAYERYGAIANKALTGDATAGELAEARSIYINAWEGAGRDRADSAAQFDSVTDVLSEDMKQAIKEGFSEGLPSLESVTSGEDYQDIRAASASLNEAQVRVLEAEREKVRLEIDGVLVTLEQSIKEISKSAPQLKRQLEDSLYSIRDSIHNLGQMFKTLSFAEEMENQRREIARAFRDTTNSITDFEKSLKNIGSIDPENTETIKEAIDLLANTQAIDPELQDVAGEASQRIDELYEGFLQSEDVQLLYEAVAIMQGVAPELRAAAESQHAAAKANQATLSAREKASRQGSVVSGFSNQIADVASNAGISRVEVDYLQAQAQYLDAIANKVPEYNAFVDSLRQAGYSEAEIGILADQFERLQDIELDGLRSGLQTVKDEIQDAFSDGLDTFLNGALDGLLEGDLDLGELALDFGKGLIKDIAQPGIDVIKTNISNLLFGKGLRGGGNPDFEEPLEVAKAAAAGKVGETPFERTSINLSNQTNNILQQQLQVAQATQSLLANQTTLPGITGTTGIGGTDGTFSIGESVSGLFGEPTESFASPSLFDNLSPAGFLADPFGEGSTLGSVANFGLDLSGASDQIAGSVNEFAETSGNAFGQGAASIIGAVAAIPGIINSFREGDTLGGIVGILGTAASIFGGGGFGLFAYGGTVGQAMAQERAITGKAPQLAVVHEGEEILTTMNEDAQTFRTLQKSGAWDLIKGGANNYAYGGTIGPKVTRANFVTTKKGNDKSGGDNYNTIINVPGINDRAQFQRTQTQIANRNNNLQQRSARRRVNA
jgi:hypothetical protein